MMSTVLFLHLVRMVLAIITRVPKVTEEENKNRKENETICTSSLWQAFLSLSMP